MYSDLAGKTACVTGAGRAGGIGAAIAKRLAEEGCNVVVSDIGSPRGEAMPEAAIGSTSELNDVVAEIKTAGGKAVAACCDVLNEDNVAALCQTASDTFGGLDIVINNAGIGYLMSPIVETTAESWDAGAWCELAGRVPNDETRCEAHD